MKFYSLFFRVFAVVIALEMAETPSAAADQAQELAELRAAVAAMQKTIVQLQSQVTALQERRAKDAVKPVSSGVASVVAGIKEAVAPAKPGADVTSMTPVVTPGQSAEMSAMPVVPGTNGIVRVYDDPGAAPLDVRELKSDSRFAEMHELGDSGWWISVGGLLKTDLVWYENTGADSFSSDLTLSQSRLHVDMRRDSDLGTVRLYYETNFNWNVRHLYAQVGRLTFGQTWSVFYDVNASPDLMFFTAMPNFGYRLEPQIRYSFPLSAEGWSLTAAVESSGPSDYVYGASYPDNGYLSSRLPTFLLQTRREGRMGHLQISGLLRDLHLAADSVEEKDDVAYAVAVTGSWKLGLRDHLVGGVTYGQGADDYTVRSGSMAVLNSSNRLDIQHGWSVFAGYQHLWTDHLRSQLSLSHSEMEGDADFGGFGDAVNSADSLQANLIWSITSSFSAGLEYRFNRSNYRWGGTDYDSHMLFFSLMYELF